MYKFYFYNKDLTELVEKKLNEFIYIPLPEAWLKKLNKPSNEEVMNNKKQLMTKIRKSYSVNLDRLVFMVGNLLAESVAYNPGQENHKWQNNVINLPVKSNKFELMPYDCLYYGGTYHDFKDYDIKLGIDNENQGNKIFDEQLEWINRGQLIIVSPVKKGKTIDVSKPKRIKEELLISKKKQYPLLRYGTKFNYLNKEINNVLDNLVAQNLIKNGVLTKDEVKNALKENYMSLPSKEVAKTRKFNYVLKPGTEEDINNLLDNLGKK